MGRWVRIDRRYNQPYRLTAFAWRVILKWAVLILGWVFVNAGLAAAHLGLLILATTAGLIWYAVRSAHRGPTRHVARAGGQPAITVPPASYRFNPPPDWPAPPPGWVPPLGWQPDPTWPPAPPGWQCWVRPARGAVGERNSRLIPQDVKIQVSVRDQGRCVQCGSDEDLHYDHKIPWSKGGTNTDNNIQLLCGTCNRRKGTDDILAY
jgi:hypothetical protein